MSDYQYSHLAVSERKQVVSFLFCVLGQFEMSLAHVNLSSTHLLQVFSGMVRFDQGIFHRALRALNESHVILLLCQCDGIELENDVSSSHGLSDGLKSYAWLILS